MNIYVVYFKRYALPHHVFPQFEKQCFIAENIEQVKKHMATIREDLDEFYDEIGEPMELNGSLLTDLLVPRNLTGKPMRIADVDIMFQEAGYDD